MDIPSKKKSPFHKCDVKYMHALNNTFALNIPIQICSAISIRTDKQINKIYTKDETELQRHPFQTTTVFEQKLNKTRLRDSDAESCSI